MNMVKQIAKEASALIVIACVLGFVGNELRRPEGLEPFKNYFEKRVPDQKENVLYDGEGPSSPANPEHGTLMALRRQWPSSVQWALRSGNLRKASTQAMVMNAT